MPEIMVAVGAIVEDEKGRVLLVRHRAERGGFWQGKWICPGGKLEFGETIEDGIRREVREETGLDIELIRPLPAFDRVVKSGGETTLHVVYLDYLAKKIAGDVRPGSDVAEAMWCKPADIPGIWGELHEDTRKLLSIGGLV